jgi:hypothetical protein
MPQVCANHNSVVAIELRRTAKNVLAVMTGPDQVRRIKTIPIKEFDKEFHELMKGAEPYPVELAITKWLDSSSKNFIPLAAPAERELKAMLVVIKKDASGIMSVEQDDSRHDQILADLQGKALLVKSAAALLELDDEALIKLFNACYPKHAIETFKDKKKVTKAIWDYIEKNKEELQMQKMSNGKGKEKAVNTKTMAAELPDAGKGKTKGGPHPGREGTPGKEKDSKLASPAATAARGKGKPAPEPEPEEELEQEEAVVMTKAKGTTGKTKPTAPPATKPAKVKVELDAKALYKTLEKKTMKVGSNREVVFEACNGIKKNAGATVAQITAKAELDEATVTFCIKQMIADGRITVVK